VLKQEKSREEGGKRRRTALDLPWQMWGTRNTTPTEEEEKIYKKIGEKVTRHSALTHCTSPPSHKQFRRGGKRRDGLPGGRS